jgi:hypothetical protein
MERSSPSRVSGSLIRSVTIGGEIYMLSNPDRVRKAADEEAVIISRRQVPECLSQDERTLAMNALVCGIASLEEWVNYRRSLWNISFRFWNALDVKDKANAIGCRPSELSGRRSLLDGVAWAYELFNSEDRTEEEFDNVWAAIRMVSQEDAIKNSSGSPHPAGTHKTDIPTSAAGPHSINSSPSEE